MTKWFAITCVRSQVGRMLTPPPNPDAILAQLRELSISVPNLGAGRMAASPTEPDALMWLGRLAALISQQNHLVDEVGLNSAVRMLGSVAHDTYVANIMQLLYKALARAEQSASTGMKGTFIATGSPFDAFAAIANVMSSATKRIVIVDPYLSARVVTDFVVAAPDGIPVDLLSDSKSVKADLSAAVKAFVAQYSSRPLSARLTAAGHLHDRLIIIDDLTVWDLSQSIKDFANRSPGGITKSDAELSALKVAHYGTAWQTASVLP